MCNPPTSASAASPTSRRLGWHLGLYLAGWLAVFVGGCVVVERMDSFRGGVTGSSPGNPPAASDIKKPDTRGPASADAGEPPVRLHGGVDGNGRRDVVTWKREDAIAFGLEKVSKAIDYLFIAAAACLAFVFKFAFEPLVDSGSRRVFGPCAIVLLWNSGLAATCSLLFGGMAFLYFSHLPTAMDFSIYREIGVCVLFQLVAFAFACLLLLFVAAGMLRQHQFLPALGEK